MRFFRLPRRGAHRGASHNNIALEQSAMPRSSEKNTIPRFVEALDRPGPLHRKAILGSMIATISFVSSLLQFQPPSAPAFSGSWVGTLEYRDYSDDSKQKLGTLLRIYRPKGSTAWVFRYVYDDGPHKVVQESEMVSVDWVRHKYVAVSDDGKETNTYDLDGVALNANGLGKLVLSGPGTENHVQVDIRETLTIAGNLLDILRESRIPGQAFKFRHEYAFVRVSER